MAWGDVLLGMLPCCRAAVGRGWAVWAFSSSSLVWFVLPCRLVELLFDDLLDWSDWFYRERVLAPWGLVALGSDEVHYQDYSEHAMQGARFESGLDNSPMYDGNFYDPSTHQMLVSRLQRHRRRAERLHLF